MLLSFHQSLPFCITPQSISLLARQDAAWFINNLIKPIKQDKTFYKLYVSQNVHGRYTLELTSCEGTSQDPAERGE